MRLESTLGAEGYTVNELRDKDEMADSGVITTTDTTAVSGKFSAVQVIEDAVFSAFTETGGTGSMTGFTLTAGLVIYGRITGYTLTSGKVRAYKS